MALRICRPELEVHASSCDGLVIARQGSNRDEYNNRTSGNRNLRKYKSVLHNVLSKDSKSVTTGG
jgi:hypothetical protein